MNDVLFLTVCPLLQVKEISMVVGCVEFGELLVGNREWHSRKDHARVFQRASGKPHRPALTN